MSRARAKKDRGNAARVEADFYPTPSWTVERLLDNCPLLRSKLGADRNWLEPCAGQGHIINAVDNWILSRQLLLFPELGELPDFQLIELRNECQDFLEELLINSNIQIGDYIKMPVSQLCVDKFDVGLTNPPFTTWLQFQHKMRQECEIVCLLLRIGVLGSAGRKAFWQKPENNCDIYLLSDRVSCTGDGQSDTEYYGWFLWHPEQSGKWRVI